MMQVWNNKYIESHLKELHTNIYWSLEIEQYLKKTFKNYSFRLHTYQINFTRSTLNIFLSVCKIKQAYNKKKELALTKQYKNNFLYNIYVEKKIVQTFSTCKSYRLKNLIKKQKIIHLNSLIDKIIQSLKIFTKNKLDIFITIREINFINSIEEVQQIITDLYKFQKTSFFSEGQKILAPTVNQKSAQLLGNFISTQLQKLTKQQNFFFNFLKESLALLIAQKFSKVKGIKIVIKGRIKKANRSKIYRIKLGKISLISINSKISYAEHTAFTSSKGTIGVKTWISKITKMFLQPKKIRYKKIKKGKIRKLEFKTNKLQFGTIGLKSTHSAVITARQLESTRQAISRKIKKKGKIWIRVFPDLPITAKPISSRMGKGKGSLSHWGVKVKGGTVILEICGLKDLKIIKTALKTGSAKLPIKTKITEN